MTANIAMITDTIVRDSETHNVDALPGQQAIYWFDHYNGNEYGLSVIAPGSSLIARPITTYWFVPYAGWTPNYWIQTELENISGTDIALSISWQQMALEANASTSFSVLFQFTVADEVNRCVLEIFLVVDSDVSGL
jgi:hypothetical protein